MYHSSNRQKIYHVINQTKRRITLCLEKQQKRKKNVTIDAAVTMQTESTSQSSLPEAGETSTTPAKKAAPSSILTLTADADVETLENKEDTIWHELQNAHRTPRS